MASSPVGPEYSWFIPIVHHHRENQETFRYPREQIPITRCVFYKLYVSNAVHNKDYKVIWQDRTKQPVTVLSIDPSYNDCQTVGDHLPYNLHSTQIRIKTLDDNVVLVIHLYYQNEQGDGSVLVQGRHSLDWINSEFNSVIGCINELYNARQNVQLRQDLFERIRAPLPLPAPSRSQSLSTETPRYSRRIRGISPEKEARSLSRKSRGRTRQRTSPPQRSTSTSPTSLPVSPLSPLSGRTCVQLPPPPAHSPTPLSPSSQDSDPLSQDLPAIQYASTQSPAIAGDNFTRTPIASNNVVAENESATHTVPPEVDSTSDDATVDPIGDAPTTTDLADVSNGVATGGSVTSDTDATADPDKSSTSVSLNIDNNSYHHSESDVAASGSNADSAGTTTLDQGDNSNNASVNQHVVEAAGGFDMREVLQYIEDAKVAMRNDMKMHMKTKIEALEETIDKLKTHVSAQDKQIKDLKSQLGDMRKTASTLQNKSRPAPVSKCSGTQNTPNSQPKSNASTAVTQQSGSGSSSSATANSSTCSAKDCPALTANQTYNVPTTNRFLALQALPSDLSADSDKVHDARSNGNQKQQQSYGAQHQSRHGRQHSTSPREDLLSKSVDDSTTHLLLGDSVLRRVQGEEVFKPSAKQQNLSVSGVTVADLQAWLQKIPERPNVHSVIVHVGINTCKHSAIHERMWRDLLHAVRGRFPHATIAASAIIPPWSYPALRQAVYAANVALWNVCNQERVTFIDHAPTFLTINGAPRKSLYHDSVHPSPRGIELMTRNLKSGTTQPQYPERSEQGRVTLLPTPEYPILPRREVASLLPTQKTAQQKSPAANQGKTATGDLSPSTGTTHNVDNQQSQRSGNGLAPVSQQLSREPPGVNNTTGGNPDHHSGVAKVDASKSLGGPSAADQSSQVLTPRNATPLHSTHGQGPVTLTAAKPLSAYSVPNMGQWPTFNSAPPPFIQPPLAYPLYLPHAQSPQLSQLVLPQTQMQNLVNFQNQMHQLSNIQNYMHQVFGLPGSSVVPGC